MKNASRNKFLLCFRPVVDMDVMLESRGVMRSSNHGQMICKSVQHQGIPKTSGGVANNSSNLLTCRPPNRKLSRVIKAVVFETILRKRVRERKGQGRGSNGHQKCVTNNETSLNDEDQKPKLRIDLDANEDEKQLISLPRSFSSSSIVSMSEEVKHKQNKSTRVNAAVKKKTAEMDCYMVYLVLAVMIFTVFWGKLGGILGTSVWLYCHPHRQSSYGRHTSGHKFSEVESRDHNQKRIIMEEGSN